MKLEDQVISLELAKKLKELGVKQDSLCYWFNSNDKYILVTKANIEFLNENKKIYSAFTAAELLELLPILNGTPVELIKGADIIEGLIYCCRYFNYDENVSAVDKNPANACAKMLIYLIENKLIEVK